MDAYSYGDLAVKALMFVIVLVALWLIVRAIGWAFRALVRTARNLPEVGQQAARKAGTAAAATGSSFKTLKDSFRAGYNGKD